MTTLNGAAGVLWSEVTHAAPCPICGKADWCSVSGDGAWACCRRVNRGDGREKTDQSGAAYYLHRLKPPPDGAGPWEPPRYALADGKGERADPDTLHRVYSALLERLELSPAHEKALKTRGLNAGLHAAGYRTLGKGRARAVYEVVQAGLEQHLPRTPGFFVQEKPGCAPYWSLAGRGGLLVPVRDARGRVVALLVRADDGPPGPRYCYLSSKRRGGPGPGSPPHTPLGVAAPAEVVRLTEGALKADVAFRLSGLPTVGASGAAAWRPALQAARELGCKAVRLAFDRDAAENPAVGRAQFACARAIREAGLELQVEDWSADPERPKGIDDLLAAGRGPAVWTGEDAWRRVGECASAAGAAEREAGPAAPAEPRGGSGKKPTQAEELLLLADGQEFFSAPDGRAFATVGVGESGPHKETLAVRGPVFRSWLCRRYYREARKAPSAKALQDALNVLEARARYDGPVLPVHCRLGGSGGRVCLDLADGRWRAVEVTAQGWAVVEAPAVRFRRTRGTLALPEPARGGSVEELRPLINVSQAEWPLLVGWLVQALNPCGPYPVLCLHGEQGSAKSTAARVLRCLIDPSSSPLRAEPRDERDLIITATNSWVVALDNLSHLPPWLSDALCRLATGGGFSTRELYTDSEEAIFEATRPVILTGIEDLAGRPDLLDRAIVLQLPVIDDRERLPERLLWERVEAVRPRVLGALLDAASAALRRLPGVRLERLPRLADLALWVAAAEPALGWAEGTFLDAYEDNRALASSASLDGSAVYPPLKALAEEHAGWRGTCQALLQELEARVGDQERKSKAWPKTARALGGLLRRLAPNLRKNGVGVEFTREAGGNRPRVVYLSFQGENPGPAPSRPSRPSHPAVGGRDGRDGRDVDTHDIFPLSVTAGADPSGPEGPS
jgi:hypothetical protein